MGAALKPHLPTRRPKCAGATKGESCILSRLLLSDDNGRLLGSVDTIQELSDILVLHETLTVQVGSRLRDLLDVVT